MMPKRSKTPPLMADEFAFFTWDLAEQFYEAFHQLHDNGVADQGRSSRRAVPRTGWLSGTRR
jgi:hypothetical protein